MLSIKNKKRGFTLIELLVVIAIIGILATIVLVSLNTARLKARDARRQSDMHQVALAMEMYYDSQSPPGYLQSATIPTAIGTFMPAVPVNPGGGSCADGPSTLCAYVWLTNMGATNSGKYLICAPLERGGATYSSQNGTKTKASGTGCPAALE